MPALDNPKHERFAQLVGTGETATEAYRTVWGATGTSAEQCASRLRKQAKVAARISEIHTGYVKHCQEQAAKQVKQRYLTLDRKRELLNLIAETPVGEIDEKSPLCQSVKRTFGENGSIEYKTPDKLRAIELDAKLAGELIDRQEVKDVTPRVTIEELRERIESARARAASPRN